MAAPMMNPATPSVLNSLRLATVIQRLNLHMQSGRIEPVEFYTLCISLSRGIDYAVANNESSNITTGLPSLLKKVCQCRNDNCLEAAIMVLMISVKNACQNGWFSEKEREELLDLANEIGNNFGGQGANVLGSTGPHSVISAVMSRFYPLLKMGKILTSIEVKPGYDAYAIGFSISKTARQPPQGKIYLFVAQTDDTETSACIISPQQVNFLLNGKGVERRTNISVDTGPQLPTNVTPMLKYGTNLLQVVGEFTGHYIIVVAYMSVMPLADDVTLQDYVHTDVATADPDSDIIEGPSRISLNCPISYSRIRIPVKGEKCKHLQCFDFRNYIGINLRRPSWRCPHCNRHVCYPDIRVDQNMVKVLKEVGVNITDVIIFADGSWKAVLESDDDIDTRHKVVSQNERPEQQEFTTSSVVLDLTADDGLMDVDSNGDIEDRKPFQDASNSQAAAVNSAQLNSTTDNQNLTSELPDDFWSDLLSSNVSAALSTTPDTQMINGISQCSSANIIPSPIITDALTPSLNHEVGVLPSSNQTSILQNQFSMPGVALLRQSQPANSAVRVRLQHIPNYVNTSPMAVQPLMVPAPTTLPPQRLRTNGSIPITSAPPIASQVARARISSANTVNTINVDSNTQHPQSSTYPTTQNWSNQNRAQRAPSVLPDAQSRNHSLMQSLSRLQTQTPHVRANVGSTAGLPSSLPPGFKSASQQAFQKIRRPPAVPVQTSGTGTSNPTNIEREVRAPIVEPRLSAGVTVQGSSLVDVPVGSSLIDVPVVSTPEQNWQPRARMRGSLSGNSIDAYKDLVIRPTESVQATGPPPGFIRPQSIPPSNLQSLFTDSRNANISPTNVSMPGPANSSGGSADPA